MASSMKRVNAITQIVRLRQVVKRWKTKSSTTRRFGSSNRLTPSGSIAIYVGPDRIRFVIPTRFLNLPIFLALLHEAEEEFGFQTAGGLVLPCEPGFFSHVVRLLEHDEPRYRGFGLDDFVKTVPGFEMSGCKDTKKAFLPVLQKTRV